MIRIRELGKDFGSHRAVGSVTLDIRTGETLGLLGPNGAGKTTTISMLIGLLTPDRGEVLIDSPDGAVTGSPVDPAVRRRIGISPQSLSLYDELTGAENLRFFGRLYGMGGERLGTRTAQSLELAGLTERRNDRVSTYSGGMKRRLNIATAMMHEPEILLLDEPTVGVDPQSRNHIFATIESLQEGGITVLYTTHHMSEAERLCDRVAIMDEGEVLALDTVPRLVAQHGGESIVTAELTEPARLESYGLNGLQREDLKIEFRSANPLEVVATMTRQGVQFSTLNVARPDLENVFLKLTGRRLRD